MNYEYLKYIDGQDHILCQIHKMPLIFSSSREKKCNCGRKENFTCPNLNCTTCICKQCADNLDCTSTSLISMNDNNTADIDSNDSDDELEEPIENYNMNDTHPHHIIQENDDEFMDEDFNEGDDNIEEDELNEQNNTQKDTDIIEKDDFDDFIAHTEPPDIDEHEFLHDNIPTTDAGEFSYDIDEEIPCDRVHVSGHVILNQNGTVLSRKKHQIKGSSIHKFFLQKICATHIGSSVPLLYPESMLFPSIFYHMTNDGAISGAIPSPLLTEFINQFGFQPLPQHIRSRLTSCSFTTGTDPRYISFSYDTMTNLAVNHEDSRIVLHRGLTVDKDSDIGLGVRRIK